jgi:hypothetical protein
MPEDEIRLPLIESAAKDLAERGLFTREQFDALDAAARDEAFTVAGIEAETTLGKIRDALSETIATGASKPEFLRRVEESVGEGTFLGDAHAETVFRTNVQTAYSRGMDEILNHPVITDEFPYEQILPILDNRVRPWHARLSKYGLNGTGIYRRDDPIYQQFFKPPSDYNCRCARNPLTLEQAAAKGVLEAKKWLETGEPPDKPEWVKLPPWWEQSDSFARLATRDYSKTGVVELATGPHKFSSTQLNLPGLVAALCLDLSSRIPDDELAGDGRESEPHVYR